MYEENRFHLTDTQYAKMIDTCLKSALEKEKITKDDMDILREYVMEINATKQITPKRTYKLYYTLIGWRDFIGPYRDNSIADIYQGIEKLPQARKENGNPRFKKNTICDYIFFIKRFYLWLVENGHTSIDEKKLRKIKSPRYDTMTKTIEMLPAEEDVKAMIEASQRSMDRALISMLYEGAFRIGELGNLKWQQVKFTDWNATVNVNDKTEMPRHIPLVMSRQYLAEWKEDYPGEPAGENYVFLTTHHKQLQYEGVAKQLKVIARRAGVEKKITPHMFRHARITNMINQGWGESVIKKMCWGNLTTQEFKTYAHLVDSDIEREAAIHAGITTPTSRKTSRALESRQCQRCYTVCGPTARFCPQCGKSLTGEVATELDAGTRAIQQTDVYRKMREQIRTDLLKELRGG